MKKYIMTDEKLCIDGAICRRIKAVRNFGKVKAGDLGGYVENENNLSHDGDCWIYGNACVCGNASVRDDAKVGDEGELMQTGKQTVVCGYATVREKAEVTGNSIICGLSDISGEGRCEDSAIGDGASVFGKAVVMMSATICNNAMVYEDAEVVGGRVQDDAEIYGCSTIEGNVILKGKAKLYGGERVDHPTTIDEYGDTDYWRNNQRAYREWRENHPEELGHSAYPDGNYYD